MKSVLPLFVMVDACGWELAQEHSFARTFAPHARRLQSVLGYSSACIPSIVSGRWPMEHRNWCYFVYDPAHSPFRGLRGLQWIPDWIGGRRKFRRWLGRMLKRQLKFNGYFDLYNIPFRDIHLFDFTEKKSPFSPGGMNAGENIFDELEREEVPYFVSCPDRTEEENLAELVATIGNEEVDFAFMYWPGLDGLMHRVGTGSPQVPARLRSYELWIESLLDAARGHYHQVHLYVFSDHGMADCREVVNLQEKIKRLPVRMPRDYAVVYDSTMARFWFFNDAARREITSCLSQVPQGRVLGEEELRELGAYFPDGYFGELIFLVDEGVQIVPSYMGRKALTAMHGYHPSAKQSYAALFSNQPHVPAEVKTLPDLFGLMKREAELAKAANRFAGRSVLAGKC